MFETGKKEARVHSMHFLQLIWLTTESQGPGRLTASSPPRPVSRPGYRGVLQDELLALTALDPHVLVVRAGVVEGRLRAAAELTTTQRRQVTLDAGSLLLKVTELDAFHVQFQVPQHLRLGRDAHVNEELVQVLNGCLHGLLLSRGDRRRRRGRRGGRRLRARRHGSTTGRGLNDGRRHWSCRMLNP